MRTKKLDPFLSDVLRNRKLSGVHSWIEDAHASKKFQEILVHRIYIADAYLKKYRISIGYPLLLIDKNNVLPCLVEDFSVESCDLKEMYKPYSFKLFVINMLDFVSLLDAVRSVKDGSKNKKNI